MARFLRHDLPLEFADGTVATRAQLDANPHLLSAHAGQRIVCRCTPSGVEMLIRHRQGRPFLANLPGRTHHHAFSCPSYSPDPLIDPLRHYSGAALARSGDALHIVVSPAPLGRPPFAHFSPNATLELLWDLAGLTRWSPRMRGRRTYAVVRAALLGAARTLHIQQRPIATALYAPDHANARPASDHLFVVGRVLHAHPAPHGVGLTLAHDQSGERFWVNRHGWCPDLATHLGPAEAPHLPSDREIWLLGRLRFTSAGHFRLDSPGLISVTTDRLPARDSAEAALLYWLVDQGRRFRRCPALDARTDPAIPFVEVLDTSRPCYVFSPQSERVPMPAHLAGHVHCAGRTRRSPSKIGLHFLS